jgi:hypothetical protein
LQKIEAESAVRRMLREIYDSTLAAEMSLTAALR